MLRHYKGMGACAAKGRWTGTRPVTVARFAIDWACAVVRTGRRPRHLFAALNSKSPALATGRSWASEIRQRRKNSLSASTSVGLVSLGLSLASATFVPNAAAEPAAMPREVLAIFDGREEQQPDQTRIHRFAEMPLNYLGFVVNYWDISKGPPPAERTANILGILTWFERAQTDDFYQWARTLPENGKRVVVLGQGGFTSTDQPSADAQGLFNAIGFQMQGPFTNLTYTTRLSSQDPMVGFERSLDLVLPGYPKVTPISADVAANLVLQRPEGTATAESALVLTSNHGGFAASDYFFYVEPVSQKTKWIIDPFAFFRNAFGAAQGPIPDVTTLSGQRIYFSHIDGDGWNNVSQIASYRDTRPISAEVVQRELIAAYPDLPVSVGVIGADIDSRYGPVEAARRTARALFELPQVEVAVHSYTHPYLWSFFESYDQKLEAQLTGKGEATASESYYKDRLSRLAARLFPNVAKKYGEKKHAEGNPPRAYSLLPFDLDQEVRGAVELAQELAPTGKHTQLYLWSGEAEPFEAAIAATRKLGVRNMNGGDTRFDAEFPSITSVAPLTRPVGDERQVYAVNSNDFLYINGVQGREHGFMHLQATVSATEEPRRLKPVNIYYHMYAGETSAQLAAVRYNLDMARKSAITPVAASQYPAIVDGFMSAEIVPIDANSWHVRNRGALQTVRFDGAKGLLLDLAHCIGVIGQTRKGSALYVALDENQPDAVVALSPAAMPDAAAAIPYLSDSRWQLRNLERGDCAFSFVAQGFGPGHMDWNGLIPGKYHIVAKADGRSVWEQDKQVDVTGHMEFTVEASAILPLNLTAACADARG